MQINIQGMLWIMFMILFHIDSCAPWSLMVIIIISHFSPHSEKNLFGKTWKWVNDKMFLLFLEWAICSIFLLKSSLSFYLFTWKCYVCFHQKYKENSRILLAKRGQSFFFFFFVKIMNFHYFIIVFNLDLIFNIHYSSEKAA